jgi:hypothetical protein
MSRLLAWCSGASLGLVVGALLGQSVRDAADFRAARRASTGLGAPQATFGHTETLEPLIGAHSGAQHTDDTDEGIE